MLKHLLVKNLALIDQAEIEFGPGLNILTGETGAGKSVLIGSVNAALGGRVTKEMIRSGAESAYIELVFTVETEKLKNALASLDVEPDEYGTVVITRKITERRSVSRINDEAVSAQRMKAVTGLLIDIHGQHEHQSLLIRSRHLAILDEYGAKRTGSLRKEVAASFRRYQELKKKMESFSADEDQRTREADFLNFEVNEIEEAGLSDGEEEELEKRYRRFSNARNILASLMQAKKLLEGSGLSGIVPAVDEAYRYDEELKDLHDMAYDLDSLSSDLMRALDERLDGDDFDEEAFRETEERLDQIRHLEQKYGKTIPEVLEGLKERKQRLDELANFDLRREETERALAGEEGHLRKLSEALSAARRETAKELTAKISGKLADLNFLDTRFTMEFRRLGDYTANGFDDPEFVISSNPGEPLRPLGQAASGGELSRIMLAIKTVLAETDDIPTLIFDEIDTGISGRTAQKVSEQLGIISRKHQVICITHLPQIAAMADRHFEIRKEVAGGRTVTRIRGLSHEEMSTELARLLGGAEITPAVLQNAREMKALADREKENGRTG